MAAALEQMKSKFKLENAGRCKHITNELYTIHASQLRTATSQAIIKSSYISPYFNIQYLGIIHIKNILYKRIYFFSATLYLRQTQTTMQYRRKHNGWWSFNTTTLHFIRMIELDNMLEIL